MEGAFQTHENTNGASGNLRDDVETIGMCLIKLCEHLLPNIGCFVGLVEVHADGDVGVALRHFAHPGPFVCWQPHMLGGELENATAVLVHCCGDGEEFVFFGGGAGNKLAALAAVNGCAAGGEAESAGGHCFVNCLRHLFDVVVGGCFVGGTTFAHYIGAQWTVCNLRADIDDALLLREGIHVFGK